MSEQREPVKVVADIIQAQLNLADDRVVLDNQMFVIPQKYAGELESAQPFLVVSYMGPGKVIAAKSEVVEDPQNTFFEEQSATILYLIQIDFMSFDNTARLQKEQVVMALRSYFSRQKQDEQSIQIARLPSSGMQNTSFLEGGAMLTRYTMTITVTAAVSRRIPLAEWWSKAALKQKILDFEQPQVAVD